MTGDTYLAAGVDREAAKRTKDAIVSLASGTLGPQVIGGIGFFGGMYQLAGYNQPVLVSSTDSVGTKVKIASIMEKFDTVGMDLVNHCINDVFTCGARPLFFLDYIGVSRLVPAKAEALVKGMAEACKIAECSLIGGETAELPGVYPDNEFDIVGFVVGAVEKENVIDGRDIKQGDALLGISSNGLHTNGYSLARRVFQVEEHPEVVNKKSAELGKTIGEALLEPHRSYYPLLEPALPLVKGMAHITGGGLYENVPRVLPDGLGALFHTSSWDVPPIFSLIQRAGNVSQEEMFRVFNMGLGMVLVCDPQNVDDICRLIPEARVVGSVVGDGAVTLAR